MKNTNKISFWTKHKKLVHGYSVKGAGSMSFRSGSRESVELSRRNMADDLGIVWQDVLVVPLSHSNKVLSLPKDSLLSKDKSGSYASGGHIFAAADTPVHNNPEWQSGIDAIVTDMKGIFPVIMSADCAAVALYDQSKEVIALAHAGLIGAVNDIATNTAKCMMEEFGSDPADIEAVIFPSIRKCHYDLGRSGAWKRIKGDVLARYGANDPVFRAGMFDLQGMVTRQLKGSGIAECNIFDTGLCTVCNGESFFSNLAAGDAEAKKKEGRFASIVGMRL